MKIALISSGIMPIPPKNWGGVENFIWIYNLLLTQLGHKVVIFNTTDLKKVADDINGGDFDFVHLHYDEYARFFNKYLLRPFCVTTHYGYVNKTKKWAWGYYSIYADTLNSLGIIALSDEIAKRYLDDGYKGKIYSLRVGTNVSDFKFNKTGNGKALCLGKIELRKKQAFLAKHLNNKVDIDFIGPVVDKEFKESGTCRYLGVWDKPHLYEHLTDYSCLVLFSDGEAAPAVVIEALATGLSIVISESASANLDDKKFITILPDDTKDINAISDAINEQIKNNNLYRDQIRQYAEQKFDNKVIMEDYIKIIDNFKNTILSDSNKEFPTLKQLPVYWFSRFWLYCSHSKSIRKVYDLIRGR